MAKSPKDSRRSAELKAELSGAFDRDTLGQSWFEVVECGAAICKALLRAESSALLNATTAKLVERLPKTFASSALYATSSGEQAIYVATSNGDLSIEAADEFQE